MEHQTNIIKLCSMKRFLLRAPVRLQSHCLGLHSSRCTSQISNHDNDSSNHKNDSSYHINDSSNLSNDYNNHDNDSSNHGIDSSSHSNDANRLRKHRKSIYGNHVSIMQPVAVNIDVNSKILQSLKLRGSPRGKRVSVPRQLFAFLYTFNLYVYI